MFSNRPSTRTAYSSDGSSTNGGTRINLTNQARAMNSLLDGERELLDLPVGIAVHPRTFADQGGMANMTTENAQRQMGTILERYANANMAMSIESRAQPNRNVYREEPQNALGNLLPTIQPGFGNAHRQQTSLQTSLAALHRVDTVYTPQSLYRSGDPSQSTQPNPTANPFRPSWQVLGVQKPVNPHTFREALSMGIDLTDSKYEGHINERFIENKKCPDDQNCSLFLMGINPDATDKEVLATVTEGKIFVFDRKKPVPGHYNSSAADLTFFNRQAAAQYMRKFEHRGVSIRGRPIHVVWNKHRVWPAKECELHQTRVVKVEGNHHFVNYHELEALLRVDISFRLVEGFPCFTRKGTYGAIFVFGKVLGQSRAAFKKLREEVHKRGIAGQVLITYGPDPCGN